MDDEVLESILIDMELSEDPPAESFDFDIQTVLDDLGLAFRFTRTFGVS